MSKKWYSVSIISCCYSRKSPLMAIKMTSFLRKNYKVFENNDTNLFLRHVFQSLFHFSANGHSFSAIYWFFRDFPSAICFRGMSPVSHIIHVSPVTTGRWKQDSKQDKSLKCQIPLKDQARLHFCLSKMIMAPTQMNWEIN